jgi:protein-tyrosine-phosphatase
MHERRAALTKKKKLVFVCTINRHRSVLAEYLFRDFLTGLKNGIGESIEVKSAGIVTKEQKAELKKDRVGVPRPLFGYRPMPCVVLYMQKAGIDTSEHRSKALTRPMVMEADLIVTLGEGHKRSILSLHAGAEGKVVTLAEISRPFEFENIVVDEPPGLMPRAKFCMRYCDQWFVTESIMREIKKRLEEAFDRIIAMLGV